MTNHERVYNSLPENERIALIEKVMPCSGTFRQHDNRGAWSVDQWKLVYDVFVESIDWEQGELAESICVHDKIYIVNGTSVLGNDYEASGLYSDGTLVEILEVEHLNSGK